MEFLTAGIVCVVLLLALMAIGLQIGLSFLLSGFIIAAILLDPETALSMIGQSAYFSIASPTWTAIPLFILMGAFASDGGLARRAYDGVHALTGRVRGSLLIATCFSCGVFGAVSGSSIATTAIFGKMALPEMRRMGYNLSLSIGCITSAGTFASMIPPSMMMIIYALFTQQSIGKLFAAGLIPGLLTAVAYAVLINGMVRRNPALAPTGNARAADVATRPGPVVRAREAAQMWPVLLVGFIILGGIYSGTFTPTEAAAAGAAVTLAMGWYLRAFTRLGQVTSAMRDAANVTAMLFLINIGALFYSRILALTGLPTEMTDILVTMDVPPFVILCGVMLVMFLLGMIMVPVGIYALTLPVVFPLLVTLGYDPIWFGVIALKLTEIGAITPPVGLNVFAVKGVIPRDSGISTDAIYRGCFPFLLCDLAVLAVLVAFPSISLWLPEVLLG